MRYLQGAWTLRPGSDIRPPASIQAGARPSPLETTSYVDSAVRAGSGLDIFKRTPPVFGEHVAEHDPARVLREIDAKRSYLPCTWSARA